MSIRPNRSGGRIPPPAPDLREEISFSLKHLDLSDREFRPSAADGYLEKFLERLRSLSAMRVEEFRTTRSRSHRIHPIRWAETSRPNGFAHLNSQMREHASDAWQFEISVNEHGRVHGFLLGPVFHIVWLDPDHRLYP